MAISDAFIWGAGGQKITPAEVARRREEEDALIAKGIDTSPVGHWTQGAARVADALAGSFRRGRLDKAEKEIAGVNKRISSPIVEALFGGSTRAATSSAIPASGASGEIAATSPVKPIDMTGNEVYSQFMDTVKGGVKNPYALAAIAATGQRESRFSPGNVNRTWSDPSQSGQPGTAGGIMSWRGPRYEALAATGDLSPAGQAKFFLQENPQLIQALNNAGSVEEAQRLMNNAWKFAGYDQPGGEAAARLSAAQGFLPSFQSGGEVAASTPEAAIEAISPTQGGSLTDEVASFEQTPAYSAQFPGQTVGGVPALDPPREVATMPVASVPAQQPVEVAGGGGRPAGINPAIIEALTNPQASPQTQRLAGILLEQQEARRQAEMEQEAQARDPLRQLQLQKGQLELEQMRNPQPKETDEIREYNFARSQGFEGTFADFKQQMKKAGATNVTTNVGEGDKFYENLDKKNAESFAALSEGGVGARSRIAQLGQLETLLSQSPSGAEAGIKLWLGDLGINTDKLDSLQATRSLVEKMVPEQRAPGSGPMSDADIAMYRRSLASAINQPGGNALIIGTAKAIAEYDIQMGEIADAVADREISPAEGRKRIRELNNPLAGYSEKLKSIRASAGEKSTGQSDGWSEVDGVRIRKKAK